MNTRTYKSSLFLAVFLLALSMAGFAQEQDSKISASEKQVVIDSIALFMADRYVFPDKGEEMAKLIKSNLSEGKYDDLVGHQDFAMKLTEDLRTINGDRHIGVIYDPERIAMMQRDMDDEESEELEEYEQRMNEFDNFGFEEVKRLPGNIGYLKFNQFYNASVAGPTAIAALNFLANSDAIIIDLTGNGGGSPTLIQLMTSYFFEGNEHLNSFYVREGDKTVQFWTLPYVPGKKMVDTDIYVLTSRYTFSGAEEFTYNLKNMERATIIGETTGGGAHPVSGYLVNDNFIARVPFGKAVNPITETNWEGTGIEPDVSTPRDKAFETAYLMALEKRLELEKNDNIKLGISWAVDGLKAKLTPFSIDAQTMKEYVGVYGPRKITLEDGDLYYQREDRPKMKMVPMADDLYMFSEIEYFRLRFIREGKKIIAVEGSYDNGRTDRNDKS